MRSDCFVQIGTGSLNGWYDKMFKFIPGSAISDVEAQEHYDRFFEVCVNQCKYLDNVKVTISHETRIENFCQSRLLCRCIITMFDKVLTFFHFRMYF
jgi:hypothetical protein